MEAFNWHASAIRCSQILRVGAKDGDVGEEWLRPSSVIGRRKMGFLGIVIEARPGP